MVLNTDALAENQDLATWQSRRLAPSPLSRIQATGIMLLAFPVLPCDPARAIIRCIEARRCVQQVATTRIWLLLDSHA